MSLFHAGLQPAIDSNGDPISGATWNFYATGTTTPVAVYADSDLSTSLGAVVTANSVGRFADIYLDDDVIYRAILKDAGGSNLADIDPVSEPIDATTIMFTQSGTGAVARAVESKLRDLVNVKDFGATGDGTTDDRAALAAADTVSDFTVGAGSYRIASNLTISNDVTFTMGGKFVVPSGVTLTINGQITAEATQIFDATGGGTVVINGRVNPVGWAEWWGLTHESPGSAAANVAAINAAIIALRETHLLPRTYYTNAQLTVGLSNRVLRGAGSQYDGVTEGRVTRILCSSATAHVLYVGDVAFTTIAALPTGIEVSDIYLDRSTAPNVTSGCTGLYNRYTQFAKINNVKATNSVYGFQFSGTLHTKGTDCHALRSLAGTGGTDTWKGFYIEGATSIGLNGSNASTYLIHCLAERGISITDSVGFYADGKMTDLFLLQPETSQCATGIEINGNAANTTLNYDNIDVQIVTPVVDSFTFAGIYVHNMNKYGSLEIRGGYYGPASGATAAVNVVSNLGAVRIGGGQFLMGVATTTYGVRIESSDNVIVDGCMINEATATAVILDNADNCRIEPLVKNHSNTCGAAVQIFNTVTACYLAPMASGAANKVQYGVQVVGAGDARNEYNVSGLDSACMPAANRKLDRNGVAIVAIGATGTNYATGVFA